MKEDIKIVPSGREDYCCECGRVHGYDCPKDKQNDPTMPACDGHNWEIGQVRPEWTGGASTTGNYQEIALVVCTFCGVVRKTVIRNL